MSLRERHARAVTDFIATCHRLAQVGYVASEGGNCSWRLADDLILISPTRMPKGAMTPDDVVFIDAAGKVIEGAHRPSGEAPIHLACFAARPDLRSVVHCHPPATCAIAITAGQNWLARPLFPEVIIEIGPVPLVPYAVPLSQDLVECFAPYLLRYNSFLMQNHGLLSATDGDLGQTMMRVELLECAANSIAMAMAMGGIHELDRKAVGDLEQVMRMRQLPLPGLPGRNRSLIDLYFPTV